jgi:hypothetical protein
MRPETGRRHAGPSGGQPRRAGSAKTLVAPANRLPRGTSRTRVAMFTTSILLLFSISNLLVPASHAEPADYDRPPVPLPVVTPTATDWQPKFPFPFDQTRDQVTDADITAQREMCQWYNAQYDELIRQIERFQFHRISPNGTDWDYRVGDLQQQADIVTGNIDQSVAFLAPRVQALTQSHNYVGDAYFPLYEGESFFLLWQHLSNVSAGIKAHQPNWFTGPSYQRVLRWGSRIHRSHVCD